MPAARRSLASLRGRPSGPQVWWHAPRCAPSARLSASARRWAVVWLAVLSALACAGFGPPAIRDGNYPPRRLYPEQVDALRGSLSAPGIRAGAGPDYGP